MQAMSGFNTLKSLPLEQPSEMMSRRMIVGDNIKVSFWKLKAGLLPEPHDHPEEQVTWILSGKVEFRIGDETRLCRSGDFVVIPGGVEHQGHFIEDTEIVSVFSLPASTAGVAG